MFPVEYPTASSPQAWATGTPPLLLPTLLGLEPTPTGMSFDPALPLGIGRLALRRVPLRGQSCDATALLPGRPLAAPSPSLRPGNVEEAES